MEAEIKAGKNWQMISGKSQGVAVPTEGCVVPVSQGVSLENQGLGAYVKLMAEVQKVKIPAPFGIKPEDATGEGVTVSQLKDEEGGTPQEFLNLSQKGTWLAFFESKEKDFLKITAK